MSVFFLRVIALFCWFCTFIVSITLLSVIMQPEFEFALFVIFVMFGVGSFYLGLFFWKSIKRPVLQRNVEKPDKVSSQIRRETPTETLSEMNKYYSNEALKNDLRILDDSVQLMRTTKSIDTFLSRSDLALRTALNIEQARDAGIRNSSAFLSSREVMDLKLELLPKALNGAYVKMQSETRQLKTENGKLGRYSKFLAYLKENEYELDICDNYIEIVEDVQSEIQALNANVNVQRKEG